MRRQYRRRDDRVPRRFVVDNPVCRSAVTIKISLSGQAPGKRAAVYRRRRFLVDQLAQAFNTAASSAAIIAVVE